MRKEKNVRTSLQKHITKNAGAHIKGKIKLRVVQSYLSSFAIPYVLQPSSKSDHLQTLV